MQKKNAKVIVKGKKKGLEPSGCASMFHEPG
jgi:hypothetical protein